MKTSSTLLAAGAAVGLLLLLNRNKSVDGIGAVKNKRRIWAEVEQAQRAGIDLNDKDAWEKHAPLLRKMASGKIKEDGSSPIEKRYFNQLARAYKSIAGTNIQPDQSVVRNEYGDVILVYNDYHLDKLPQTAAQWIAEIAQQNINDPYRYGYWATIAAIAQGKRFVWKGSKNKVHRGVEELVFGKQSPTERKLRISYLASPEKGGVYPEKFAHSLWERNDSVQDDQEITNGVLEAIRDCSSVKAAKDACVREYMDYHTVKEQPLFQDVPF